MPRQDSADGGTTPPTFEVVAMAVLTLLVDERQACVGSQPSAVLLHEAGLSCGQLAALVQTTAGAVRKDRSRARALKVAQ